VGEGGVAGGETPASDAAFLGGLGIGGLVEMAVEGGGVLGLGAEDLSGLGVGGLNGTSTSREVFTCASATSIEALMSDTSIDAFVSVSSLISLPARVGEWGADGEEAAATGAVSLGVWELGELLGIGVEGGGVLGPVAEILSVLVFATSIEA